MDLTGVNTTTIYNSRTGLYQMNFIEEGYYTINFYDKVKINTGTEEAPVWETITDIVNKTTFTIEKSTNNRQWNTDKPEFKDSATFNLSFNTDSDGKYDFNGFELKAKVFKSYFDALEKEQQIALTNELKLNENVFTSTTSLSNIKFFLSGDYLISAGDRKIVDIRIKDTNVNLPLFYTNAINNIHSEPTLSQKVRLCYYLGIPYQDNYEFYGYFTQEMLENEGKGLLDILKANAEIAGVPTVTIDKLSVINYNKDSEGNDILSEVKLETAKDVKIPVINYILGSLWTNTFDYGKYLTAIKDNDSYSIEFEFVFEDESSFVLKPTVYVKKYETYEVAEPEPDTPESGTPEPTVPGTKPGITDGIIEGNDESLYSVSRNKTPIRRVFSSLGV